MAEPLTPEEHRVAGDLRRNELRDRIQEAILDLDSQELMAMAAGDDMEWRRESPLDMAERIARRVAPTLDAARAGPGLDVERLMEWLHDLDLTQHYITHETGYDADDIEGVACIDGLESHREDAVALLALIEDTRRG